MSSFPFSSNHPEDIGQLTEYALLKVQGPDSERFLQGQLTCDVTSLEDSAWRMGACCTAKGRMVANFMISRDPEGYFWLRLPAEQVTALIEHLKKYAVFFKTELIDLGQLYNVWGEQPTQLTVPSELPDNDSLHQQRLCSWSDMGAKLTHADGRQEYWLPAQNAYSSSADIFALWRQQDIYSGIVWVTPATREKWIPQNINWHLQDGVSFSKGCYTGQEIVARLQYLGSQKKVLHLIESNKPLNTPSLVNAEGKAQGELLSWQDSVGLALLATNTELDQLYVSNQADKLSASVRKLSYTGE